MAPDQDCGWPQREPNGTRRAQGANTANIIIQRWTSVRNLPLKAPDEGVRNRCALTETRIRHAEVEAMESGALQGPCEGEAPPQHNGAGPAEP